MQKLTAYEFCGPLSFNFWEGSWYKPADLRLTSLLFIMILHASHLVRGRTSEVREHWSSPVERLRWQDNRRLRQAVRRGHSSVSCTRSRTFSMSSDFSHLRWWPLHSKLLPFYLLCRINSYVALCFRKPKILVHRIATIMHWQSVLFVGNR